MSEKLGSTTPSPNTGEVVNTAEDAAAKANKKPMTREQRVTDGREKLNALKDKVKEGLRKTWKKMSEGFYVGASYGFEWSGKAKEKVGNTYTAAKAKATELFAGGREVISQKASEARERKAKRLEGRAQREADRRQYYQEREQYKQDNATDKSIIREEEKKVSEAERELEEKKQELIKAREAEAKARQELKEAEDNYAELEKAAQGNPTELSKLRLEEAALAHSLKIARLKIAMANTANAQKEVRLTNSMIDKLDASIGKTR